MKVGVRIIMISKLVQKLGKTSQKDSALRSVVEGLTAQCVICSSVTD